MYRARNLDETRSKARERMWVKRGTTKVRIRDNDEHSEGPSTQRKKPHPKFRHKPATTEDSSGQSPSQDTTPPSDTTNSPMPKTSLPPDSSDTSRRPPSNITPVVVKLHAPGNASPFVIEGQVSRFNSWPASSSDDSGYILLQYENSAVHNM
ncbi:hypothetical protein VNI00_019456 [Paramarasmius palmivorus]|uniref:Uncharacterized protein n=1 Tax=Paramarasmius palmivorus TaxID=297713 RepID=A0AAW0ALF6_9AGAR